MFFGDSGGGSLSELRAGPDWKWVLIFVCDGRSGLLDPHGGSDGQGDLDV